MKNDSNKKNNGIKRKIQMLTICFGLCLSMLAEMPALCTAAAEEIPRLTDRYVEEESETDIQTAALEEVRELSADIRKRVAWTDAENGTARETLSYQSNSGAISGTKDMNIVLIQDKSGSMDCNYGFKVQLEREGLSVNDYQSITYFPLKNTQGWTESAEELVEDDMYNVHLNTDTNGIKDGRMYSMETRYNSPCQMEDHYYLLAEDESISGGKKGTFIHGNNLYQIYQTDYHHYRKLQNREEALAYLEQGRRVLRGKSCIDANGSLQENPENFYFLDLSKIVTFHGNTYLSTVDIECETNDRLARSQKFMRELVEQIKNLNRNNKIAYIPFWGDVPQNGSWKNLSYNSDTQQLYEDDYMEGFTYKEGVTSIGFTESGNFDMILQQIQNPFTYNGTNWTRALEKAISLLEARESEDLQKDTLVLFLTDGMPQGFAGKKTDVNVPLINGEEQIAKLKAMNKVSLYTVGVCINQSDGQTIHRLNQADSSGEAFFARTTGEFDHLMQQIKERLTEQYEVQIDGRDAFYTDVLGEDFRLDETGIDSSWKIVETADLAMEKGVPQNVYRIASENPQISCIYVRDTKTVYWKIGAMTDGTYSERGHQISFPLRYAGYEISTEGNDKTISANNMQRLTYVSSANLEKLLTVSLETPKLVFQRQDPPTLTILKCLEGKTYAQDKTFYFSICREKQFQTVKSREKNVTIQVKANNSSGQVSVTDLQPGTYYVYETDEKGNIKNEEEEIQIKGAGQSADGEISLSINSQILTVQKDSFVPTSVVSSDGTSLANEDNYLKISSNHAEIVFTEYAHSGNLQVIKTIQADDDTIWWKHGNPLFIVRVSGMGTDGKQYTFYHTFEFTKEYVEKNKTKEGICSMNYTFEDIPLSENYKVEEVCSERYRLAAVSGNGSNVQILRDGGKSSGYFSLYANVNLQEKTEGTVVELQNEKTNNQWYSHTAHVRNQIL